MYSERLGKLSFAVYFVGFNLLYFPMFLAWETPRRVFHYPEGTELYHQLATVGAFVIGTGVLLVFITLAKSFVSGPDAPDNPWAYSRTAEWATTSPPPLENWPNRPSYANGRLEFVDDATAADGGAVAHERTGAAESLEADHEDHASIWPFGIGVGMFVMFLGLSGLTPYVADFATARGAELAGSTAGSENVLYPCSRSSASASWGSRCSSTDARNSTHPRWPSPNGGRSRGRHDQDRRLVLPGLGRRRLRCRHRGVRVHADPRRLGQFRSRAALGDDRTDQHLRPAATSSFTVVLALVMAERGNKRGLLSSMGATLLLGLTFLGIKGYEWSQEFAHDIYWFTDLEYSMYFVTTGLHALHVILGLLIAAFLIYRIVSVDAYLDDDRPVEYFGLYWHFVDIVWVILFPLFYLM